jgi:hypothetical protein
MPKNTPYLKIKNFYDENELKLIWQELDFLTYKSKLTEATGQKRDNWKNNHGIFLDEIYSNRNMSNILTVNRKIWSPIVMNRYSQLSLMHRYIEIINQDNTLVSYYENSGFYKPHRDVANLTVLQWFFKEPKAFSGGNFKFTDLDEVIEIENNMTVMFPSCLVHEVSEISMQNDENEFSGYGRYCITNFSYLDPIVHNQNQKN